ncbi:hypothetical protein P5673_018548 [Acropora cervicornis]|uniref:Uncharacterized protein n=1 Tax=Acropora cervicornis TaxID=6130 RepID=A0AAD9QCY7_ACRCE|nr:hypothetical protein P5673_018548 [Acropora cervicornis]
MEFRGLRPNMKIMQWKFESLKPIFVKTAKECDKKSCLCRRHVEIKILFGDCMKLCKAVLKNKDRDEAVCVPLTIAAAAEKMHITKCNQCGVHFMELLPEEESNEGVVICLLEHLPLDHVVAIQDYSEGYTSTSQDEKQSECFDVAKVSLHVTNLYCHSTEKNDGIESTEKNLEAVKEHVFLTSDDVIQDNNSVHSTAVPGGTNQEVQMEPENTINKGELLAVSEDENLATNHKKVQTSNRQGNVPSDRKRHTVIPCSQKKKSRTQKGQSKH